MRILHTADLHLRADDDERWEALGVVLEKTVELDAGVLVISGDMFDKNVDAQRLKTALRELFDSYPGRVVLLPGNHDQRGLGADDYYGERVSVLADRTQTIDLDGVRIAGLPFEDVSAETVLERLLSMKARVRPGATNVLLYHGELLDLIPVEGAFGDEVGHEYMPARLSAFAGLGFDYVLAGHFHRGYDVRRYENGYFVYPGSPVSVTRKETGIRHVNLVEAGKPPRAVELDTRHAVELDFHLDPFDQTDPIQEIRERLAEVHRRAAVYLNVTGFTNLEAIGKTEAEFESAVKQFIDEETVEAVFTRWSDVSAILDNELFKRFSQRLADSDLPPEIRDSAREMVIDAFTETMHED